MGFASDVSASGLLLETNHERNMLGVEQLYQNTSLAAAAQAKADDMVTQDYWSHYSPDGQAPWVFIDQVGYAYLKAGENLAYGFPSSKAVVKGWMDSPSHRANLLDSQYREVGFGIANGSDYQGNENTVVVAMYADPSSGSAGADGPDGARFNAATGISDGRTPLYQALINGQAHYGIYLSVGILIGIGIVFLIRHLSAIYQYAHNFEHHLEGHPLLEAAIIYGLIWLVLFNTWGAVL